MHELIKKHMSDLVVSAVCFIILLCIGVHSMVNENKTDDLLETSLDKNDRNNTISVYIGGEVITPGTYELKAGSRVGDAVEAAGGFTENANEKTNIAVKLKDGNKITIAAKGEDPYSGIDFKININTAGVNDFMMIDGIGEKTAAKIIEFRDKSGKFRKIEDIMNVDGIGRGTFEKIKDLIVIE